MRKLLVLLVLVPALAYAGNPFPDATPNPNAKTGHWRWAYQDKDTWWKSESYFPGKEVHTSWFDHSVGSYMLYEYFRHNRKHSVKRALVDVLIAGTLWECKDAIVPYERWGKVGGEGFSGQDIVRDMTGALSAVAFNWITEKRTHKGAKR